jgi:hypothetical protein
MRQILLTLALASFAAGCGGGNDSVAPTPAIPNVTGNYSGSITINYQLIGRSISCPSTTTVTQSSANVTLSPLMLGGVCPGVGLASLPLGDFTITNTGSLGTQTVNNFYMATCNGYYNASASGGFFGTTLQFSLLYTVASGATCVNQLGNFTFSGTLNRL